MTVTPDDLEAAEFATVRRNGLDPARVRGFLQVVATEYRAALARADEVAQELADADSKGSQVCAALRSAREQARAQADDAVAERARLVARLDTAQRERDAALTALREARRATSQARAERDRATSQLTETRAELAAANDGYAQIGDEIVRLLRSASEIAVTARADADRYCTQVRSDADDYAVETRRVAEQVARQIRSAADEEGRRRLDAVNDGLDRLAEVERQLQERVGAIKAWANDALPALDQLPKRGDLTLLTTA